MKRNDRLIDLSMDQSIDVPFWLEMPKKILTPYSALYYEAVPGTVMSPNVILPASGTW